MRIIILFLVFLYVNTAATAQLLQSHQADNLLILLDEIQNDNKIRKQRINDYLKTNKKSENKFCEDCDLIDVVNGVPKFYTTWNNASVSTLGINDVRPGGEFGLDLKGEAIKIAVWDRGLPLSSHQEFQGRLKNSDASSESSDHSTHVTGTILAGGINNNARGFCPGAEARAFDWFQDTEEMIEEVLNNDLLISNHSYGVPGGWNGSNWFGDLSISDEEDYRFGFYDNDAAAFDQIAYNAPYYSIVVAAGNERGDSGDGTFPADGPYDCITGFSTAKNVITVGAVNNLVNGVYNSPSDVKMSNFSSWGPVDDGRIKPDFCAAGVGIFSPVAISDSSYDSFNGTSMASPAVTGAISLINETYFTFNNSFLKSATLKALVINSIREAGDSPGPDYRFGWGLVDASAAVGFILAEDDVNKYILEESLNNGETYELELNPVQGMPMSISLVWTDPQGSPATPSLDPTDLMLVNDLDMILVDEDGNEVSPWTLDPANPTFPAVKQSNFRDNVEKIDFDSPLERRYFLRINHKGQLQNDVQDFSLIIDYQSQDNSIESIYWVNDDGNWNDNNKWSDSSGGVTSSLIPSATTKLIFDNKSFDNNGGKCSLTEDLTVAGIVALSDRNIEFDLNGHTLTVLGTTLMASENFVISNGSLVFSNNEMTKESILDFNNTNFDDVSIIIDELNNGTWTLKDNNLEIGTLEINSGIVKILNSDIRLKSLTSNSSKSKALHLSDSYFVLSGDLILPSDFNLIEEGLEENIFEFSGAQSDVSIMVSDFNPSIELDNSTCTFNGSSSLRFISIMNSIATFNSSRSIENVLIQESSIVNISNDVIISNLNLSIDDSGNQILGSIDGPSNINFLDRQKFCYENLTVENVDLLGETLVSVGLNSTILNSNNWIETSCIDLVFANFDSDYLCEGGLSLFSDISDGNVENRDWFVNGVPAFGSEVMEYTFETQGDYLVALVATDPNGNSNAFEQVINISATDLDPNRIIENPTQLASLKLADSYQWYNYSAPIPGATLRTYAYSGAPGIYCVVTYKGDCNRKSEVLDLGTNNDNLNIDDIINVFPNPFSNNITFQQVDETYKEINLDLFNSLGKKMLTAKLDFVGGLESINLSSIDSGFYFAVLSINDRSYSIKLIKQ